MGRKVKFGVFADAHVDIMHDVEERLQVFLDVCRKENVDFIVELGDFCYPDKDRKYICKECNAPANTRDAMTHKSYVNKERIVSLFKNFEKPGYHVIGNHDCDLCSKEQIFAYYGADYAPYYSFDVGGFHFVVIDNNNYVVDGKEYSYANGNYFDESYREKKPFPYVPKAQLAWLKNDLEKTENPTIVFSHYPLQFFTHYDVSDEVQKNSDELMKILNEAPNGAYMSVYGHEHVDDICRIGKFWHYAINSLSNCWLGTAFACPNRYSPEIDEKFPDIKYVVPYKDAVFAIIEMDEDGATVKGVKSEFVGKTPEELGKYTKKTSGWCKTQRPLIVTPNIMDRYIPFMK